MKAVAPAGNAIVAPVTVEAGSKISSTSVPLVFFQRVGVADSTDWPLRCPTAVIETL